MVNVTKTFDPALLDFLREQGMEDQALRVEQQLGINLGAIHKELDKFITVSLDKLKDAVVKLAIENDEVLIQGESGTGKELIARALGANRKSGRFVAVNVAAIPSELVESTLFGYKAGAFTGAIKDREGLVQHAQEGTLFLDEIGDLPLPLQSKFLRVIQERKVRPVGSNYEEDVKCRFIAATHCDLQKMVDEGRFRLDLFARISTFQLVIPPLRERPNDIAAILAKLYPKFPYDKVDWSKQTLPFNTRSLIQIARRYQVLGELPK